MHIDLRLPMAVHVYSEEIINLKRRVVISRRVVNVFRVLIG